MAPFIQLFINRIIGGTKTAAKFRQSPQIAASFHHRYSNKSSVHVLVDTDVHVDDERLTVRLFINTPFETAAEFKDEPSILL